MLLDNINLGDNSKLNASKTAFSGTALLLTPAGEDHTSAATAQECCASCAQATDISLADPATVASNDTLSYIEDIQWFHGCNYFSWCALQSICCTCDGTCPGILSRALLPNQLVDMQHV